MTTSYSAPAKIILFGEHAVVYGQPAIAVPISGLRAFATIEPSPPDQPGLRLVAEDLQQTFHLETVDADNALAATVDIILQHLQVPPPSVTIRLRSAIPIASGLGSGAAIAAVLGRALSAAANLSLSDDALNTVVYAVETLHHGTPSGIDNTVVVYEQPVYFVRGKPIETLHVKHPLQLVIADTGQPAPTHIAVGDVRKLVEAHPEQAGPVIEGIGQLVSQARQALSQGEIALLGQLMTDNHTLLQQLTISSADLDHLVQTALEAGAVGAKMSGGGRGGNMIALVSETTGAQVERALRAAGAVRTFKTVVHPCGP
ncbi:MAG: mevalonate kinase [Anaerolineae bacterium]|jgi:mevalonate kinase|nr:mevalonate kinase [Anaerolineae bacterium]